MNFIYTVDPLAETPIMLINKHIGTDPVDGVGIMGDQFQAELLALCAMGKRLIDVWITSEGGNVLEGEKIYSAIMHCTAKVDTYCMGMAASIAAVIFQAGRTRYMCDFAKQMFHEVSGALPSELITFNSTIATMVSERTGTAHDVVLGMMKRTTWMLAQEALEKGFCDSIVSSSDANKGRLSKAANIKDFHAESVLIMNKAVEDRKPVNQNRHTMLKVTNRLGLNKEANEDAIDGAVSELQNKISALEIENKSKEDALKDAKDKAEKAAKDYEDMKNGFEKLDEEKKEGEKKAKEEKAKNLVKTYANRFDSSKPETVTNWEKKAFEDPEGTEELLKSIPVNAKAKNLTPELVKPENGVGNDNRKSGNASYLQAQVINNRKNK